MENSEFKEKRTFPRFNVSIPATYFNPATNEIVSAQTHDISSQGLGLLTDRELNSGTDLEINLHIYDSNQQMPIKGKVIWSNKEGQQYRAGVKLEGAQLKPLALILKIIQYRLRIK